MLRIIEASRVVANWGFDALGGGVSGEADVDGVRITGAFRELSEVSEDSVGEGNSCSIEGIGRSAIDTDVVEPGAEPALPG